jgi:hypothetical protein
MSQIQYYDITFDNIQTYAAVFEECYNLIYTTNAAANPAVSRVRRQPIVEFYREHADSRLYVMTPAKPGRRLTIYACLILSPRYVATHFSLNPRTNAFETGVGSSLFLWILREMNQNPALHFSQLNVIADTHYPFYSFSDMFDFFVSAGFHTISGSADLIHRQMDKSEAYIQTNLSTIQCFSIFHSQNLRRNEPEIAVSETVRLPISEFHKQFPFISPYGTLVFIADLPLKYDIARLSSILSIFQKIPIRDLLSKKPLKHIAYLNHSNYKLNNGKCINTIRGVPIINRKCSNNHLEPSNIAVFKVPDDVEIVIINSPGFQTNINTVPICWNFIVKYLSSFTIDELQKIFPAFQSNGEQGIPTDIFDLFTATSGGIMHIFRETFIQIHSYKAGDYCPEMSVSLNNFGPLNGSDPAIYDFAASIYGAYTLPKLDEDMKYYDRHTLDHKSYKTLLWNQGYSAQFKDLDKKVYSGYKLAFDSPLYIGTPDQTTLLTYPKSQADYEYIQSVVPFATDLSDALQPMITSVRGVSRHYILSCGSIENTVQDNIQRVLTLYPQLHNSLHVRSGDLHNFQWAMNRTGEILYDLFRSALHPAISPASPRSPRYLAEERAAWERARRASIAAKSPVGEVSAAMNENTPQEMVASRAPIRPRTGRSHSRPRQGTNGTRRNHRSKSKEPPLASNKAMMNTD